MLREKPYTTLLRTALAPHFSGIADFNFERSQSGIIKVIKQPGRKGVCIPLNRLLEAEETIPLALIHSQILSQSSVISDRLNYLQINQKEIETAIEEGEGLHAEYETVFSRLQQVVPEASSDCCFL